MSTAFPRYARWVAASVAVLGAVALFGWVVDGSALDAVSPGRITMKANTAIAFVLAGVALWLLAPPPVSAPATASRTASRRIGLALAVAVAAIGGLTLFEHLTGINLGIDQLLFHEGPGMPATMSPGRMGPPASVSFLLAGLSLLLLDAPAGANDGGGGRLSRWLGLARAFAGSHVLALGVVAVASLSLIGYAYGARLLYGAAQFTGIALPTAVGLFALGCGTLLARPDRGIVRAARRNDAGAVVLRRLLPPAVLLPFVLGWLLVAGARARLYDPAFGATLLVLALLVATAALLWWNARALSRLSEQSERAERELRGVTTHARCILWHAQIRGLPGWESWDGSPPAEGQPGPLGDGRRHPYHWDTRVQDENAAQQVLPLEVAPGQSYADAWRASQDPPSRDRIDDTSAAALFHGREGYSLEVLCRDKFGKTRWLHEEVSVRPVPPGPGRWEAFGVVTDVTERKAAEEERLRLLEREQDARAAAEEANRRKDQFLAVLSHELRTPLTPVVIRMGMMEREPGLSADLREGLDLIRRNVELETRLIDDLLDMTRIARGKMQMHLSTVDAHERLRRAVEVYRAEIEAKRLHLTMELSARRHWLRGDAARLQQVFWNLVGNAVKYTPEGGAITIGSSDEPERLKMWVADTGIGMEPELVDRAFQPFEQGEQSITRRTGGLGLGLSITRSLVELHGGRIRAQSGGPGRGSTFTVTFPVLADPGAPPPPPAGDTDAAGAPTAGVTRADGRPVRILVVEDNADTLRVMTRLLRSDGYHVETAATAADALAAAARATAASDGAAFDLVISDIGLPDATGWELMRSLRAQAPPAGASGGLRGIALSGFSMEEDSRRSREAGFAEHLSKPVAPEILEAAIRRVVARAEEKVKGELKS